MDVPQRIIHSINAEVSRGCALLPNVHLAHHRDIRHYHLYDQVHLNKEGRNTGSVLNLQQRPAQPHSYAAVPAGAGNRAPGELSQIRDMVNFICSKLIS
ncbi:hypothetical protein SKAU_G00319570 [Synaphobranchus kaupii]|uniref:Uncharacterized protein n=1 Tax=Synaphobranchus kaupii TaxID=118154 RepID=A0A9Q1IJR1_SYNKA|nr:hypothetical protein SKAU_G00319570 [Synaphobranchus kaupii]